VRRNSFLSMKSLFFPPLRRRRAGIRRGMCSCGFLAEASAPFWNDVAPQAMTSSSSPECDRSFFDTRCYGAISFSSFIQAVGFFPFPAKIAKGLFLFSACREDV